MRPNPPIKGHELLNEGHMALVPLTTNPDDRRYEVRGGCRCGARPYDLPAVVTLSGCPSPMHLGVNDVKRWHRDHKSALRLAITP